MMRRITQGEADATSVFEPCFVLRAVSLLHRRGQEHPVFDLHSFRELCRPFAVGEAKIQRRIEIASALAKKLLALLFVVTPLIELHANGDHRAEQRRASVLSASFAS